MWGKEEKPVKIDINRLRRDLAEEFYAGQFAGFDGMIMEAWEVESMSPEEVVRTAERWGFSISRYRI